MSAVEDIERSADAAPRAPFRHRGPVTCVAAVPHSSVAVTSGYDGAVGLFDLETGDGRLLGYHRHLVNRVVVNPEGTKAATSSSDYTVCVWNLLTREPERVLRGHSDDVEDFAFVDARTGVSVSRDRRVIVWDLTTGAALRILDDHEKDVLAVAYADGKIYSSGDDMTLRQWSLATGALERVWGPFEHETDTCAIDPLHGRAVLGCDDGRIRIFDTSSGSLLREVAAHSSGIKKVAVSPANGDILSAAYDQRLRIWDAADFRLKVELESVTGMWERSLNWSPDGSRVLAGTFDGTVVEWGVADGRRARVAGDRTEGNACFNDVSASADGLVALVSDDGFVRLARLDGEGGAWGQKVEPAAGRVLMNAVTLDERAGLLVAGAHNHALHVFRLEGERLTGEVKVPLGRGPVNCVRVAHSPGYEREIFAACYDAAIVRATPEGELRAAIEVHEGAVKSLRLHPERPLGVSCGADNLLLSWTLDGRLAERFLGHTAIVDDVDIDPAGVRIASVSRDFTLKVYELDGGRLQHSVALGRRSPKAVCFYANDVVIVSDYWGALIRVELNGERVTRRQIARNGISSLSRSGGRLVAASYDGSVYLVDPEDLSVVRSLEAMAQRPAASAAD